MFYYITTKHASLTCNLWAPRCVLERNVHKLQDPCVGRSHTGHRSIERRIEHMWSNIPSLLCIYASLQNACLVKRNNQWLSAYSVNTTRCPSMQHFTWLRNMKPAGVGLTRVYIIYKYESRDRPYRWRKRNSQSSEPHAGGLCVNYKCISYTDKLYIMLTMV